MITRKLAAILVVALCVGCGPKASDVPSAATKPALDALSAKGPAAVVTIGDPLVNAKSAFPPPKDAQSFDTSLSFAILSIDGWAWQHDKTKSAFEVGVRDGQVVGILVTNLGTAPADVEQREIAAFGPPTRKAENDHVAVFVWERGTQARIFIHLRKEISILGKGTMTMIGKKADLMMLNYDAGDPETTAKQLAAAAGIGK